MAAHITISLLYIHKMNAVVTFDGTDSHFLPLLVTFRSYFFPFSIIPS